MVNSSLIQIAYNRLYAELRRYIWNFEVVGYISDLEIAAYKRLPSIDEVKQKLEKLLQQVRLVAKEDEKLNKAFRYFSEILDDTGVGAQLTSFNKVREFAYEDN